MEGGDRRRSEPQRPGRFFRKINTISSLVLGFRFEADVQPEIFNTDQGSQFTSPRFVDVLRDAGVRVSMDGRGRWMDNVFIERLWRSLKYECVYIHAFETGSELRAGLPRWIDYYNADRPHSALAGATPDEAYGRAATMTGDRLAA